MTDSYFTTRSSCRLCHGDDMHKAVPLSALPVASPNVGQSTLVRDVAPADCWQCRTCGHLQLTTVVDPAFQYRNFQYETGISLGLREHFSTLMDDLVARGDLKDESFVIDVGSNDGSLLQLAKDHGATRVLGIDPAERIAREATARGIPTLAEFFTPDLAAKIKADHGRANVVISNNTVANIDDLDSLLAGMDDVLADDGIIIIETQYALDMIQRMLLDVIYHEHISYFAVRPTRDFFARIGMELVRAERIAPKGGSIRFVAQRAGGSRAVDPGVANLIAEEEAAGFFDGRLFDTFNETIRKTGEEIRARLQTSRDKTGRSLAFGASVGCAALIHYFELGELIDAVFDDTPLTNIIRTESSDVPVLSGPQLDNEMPCDVLVLAWRYTSAIARGKPDFQNRGGRFYRALPDLKYLDGSDNEPARA